MHENNDDRGGTWVLVFPLPGDDVRNSLFPDAGHSLFPDIDRSRREAVEEGWPDENPFEFVRELAAV